MGLSEQWDLSEMTDFQKRVEMAAVKAAIDVQAEALDTPNHAGRSLLATDMLAGMLLPRMARAVASNGAISAASSDSDLEFTVNSMWDAFALNRA